MAASHSPDGITVKSNRLQDIRGSGRYSDLTITCSGQSFNVHKVILDLASPVFSKMLSGGFKESTTAHTTIELHDDLGSLQTLLHWTYHEMYNDSFANGSTISFAVKVYAIADKYDIPRLQQLATQRIESLCDDLSNPEDLVAALYLMEDGEYIRSDDRTFFDTILCMVINNIKTLVALDEFHDFAVAHHKINSSLLYMLASAGPSVKRAGGRFAVEYDPIELP